MARSLLHPPRPPRFTAFWTHQKMVALVLSSLLDFILARPPCYFMSTQCHAKAKSASAAASKIRNELSSLVWKKYKSTPWTKVNQAILPTDKQFNSRWVERHGHCAVCSVFHLFFLSSRIQWSQWGDAVSPSCPQVADREKAGLKENAWIQTTKTDAQIIRRYW